MILPLLAAALFGARLQVNPPGTTVMPTQAALFASIGGAATIEVRDATGLPIPFVDAIGVKRSAVTVTLPAGTAVGLGWEITQTKPDGTNALKVVGASQYTFIVTMTCSATESPVGTYDSSAGAGNGIATGYPAPSASTPTVFASGVTYTIAAGSVITSSASGGKLPVGKLTSMLSASQTGANGLYASGGHSISRIVSDNASGTTLYLQVFDATSLPSNGSTPIAEVTVSFGISTAPTENEEAFTPDWIATTSGVYYAWSTTSGTLTLASSGTGLLVRIYGN